jgi:Sulfotransferase domain
VIIWLASYPRSGNTFFRVLLNHLYGIKTPTAYIGNDNTAFVVGKELVGHVPEKWTIPEMAAKPETLFVKTHRRVDDTYPAIYLYRDGRDALVSYARLKVAENGLNYEDVLKDLITVSAGQTGTWGQNVCHWLERSKDNTVYVSYENLIAHPEQVVEQTLCELNLPFLREKKNEAAPSFEDLQTIHNGYFRRGMVGSYKDEMSGELQDLFWEQVDNAEAMQLLGYKY